MTTREWDPVLGLVVVEHMAFDGTAPVEPGADAPTMERRSAAEIERLRTTNNEREWNAACDDVKRARGGAYPHDWFAKVIAGSIGAEAQARWGRR